MALLPIPKALHCDSPTGEFFATKSIQHLFLLLIPPTPWNLQGHRAQVTRLLTPQPGVSKVLYCTRPPKPNMYLAVFHVTEHVSWRRN